MENKLNVNVIADDGIVVPKAEYDELLRKAHVLDMIVENTKLNIDEETHYGMVDADFVLMATGLRKYIADRQRAKVIIDQPAEMGVLHCEDVNARKVGSNE